MGLCFERSNSSGVSVNKNNAEANFSIFVVAEEMERPRSLSDGLQKCTSWRNVTNSYTVRGRSDWKTYGGSRWRGGHATDIRSNPTARAQFGRSFSDNLEYVKSLREQTRHERAVASDGYRNIYRNSDWETVTVDPKNITSPAAVKLREESHRGNTRVPSSGERDTSRHNTNKVTSSTANTASMNSESRNEDIQGEESGNWFTVGHRSKTCTHPPGRGTRNEVSGRSDRGTFMDEKEGKRRGNLRERGRGGNRVRSGNRGQGRGSGRGLARGGSWRGGRF